MGSRELAADLRDLRSGFPVGEDDLRETDAPEPVEVEREVLGHGTGSYSPD